MKRIRDLDENQIRIGLRVMNWHELWGVVIGRYESAGDKYYRVRWDNGIKTGFFLKNCLYHVLTDPDGNPIYWPELILELIDDY
jgi:hypothetical protein